MTSEAFKPIVYLKENCPFFLKVASSFRNRAWHRTWKAATSLLEPSKRRRSGRSVRCVSKPGRYVTESDFIVGSLAAKAGRDPMFAENAA
ncbi:hypothetical protein Rleg10DRAFT_5160 [Rhizobium leguminosarum bv. trifolii WSM2012]|nr:hypothetical protein Rleg10DRAFT_3810 [Rhizobium leguminosarum bv. trifolii WSM2012]EJC76489.1 hypothetical protein Rleg10DRAFT_5160 [Rhizobium leguminosarum bv. trifolii WSM2012]